MRTQTIRFPEQQALCVFPDEPQDLAQAISTLELKDGYPVIVLIGGGIQEQQALVTSQVIETLAQIAAELKTLVICGGTDLGVMAAIGQIRQQHSYKFPLVGIAPEALVTWPGGPFSANFLWWGQKRWKLAPHYSHFILVPGNEFGAESTWIVETATLLSKGHRSVTILINGGNISRQDIELSIAHGRPVIVCDGTGRLANELALEPNRDRLLTIVPAFSENRVAEAIRAALSTAENGVLMPTLASTSTF